MLKKFTSSIGVGNIRVDTIIDKPEIVFGENVSGTIYIEGGNSDDEIEYIKLEVFIRTESGSEVNDQFVSKHMIELVAAVKSKQSDRIPFELVPDERWMVESENAKLILRTTVHITNGENVKDEDEITFIPH